MQDRALLHASELWSGADKDGNGRLSLVELRQLLRAASRKYSHMEEHSRFLDGCACLLTLLQTPQTVVPYLALQWDTIPMALQRWSRC